MRERKYAAGFSLVVMILSLGVLVVLVVQIIKLNRDRRLIREVASLNNVRHLCKLLLDSELSEAVRNSVISQLQQLEVHDPSELGRIEDVATALSAAESTTDRTISRRAAQLAVVLQNRYNHRKAAAL